MTPNFWSSWRNREINNGRKKNTAQQEKIYRLKKNFFSAYSMWISLPPSFFYYLSKSHPFFPTEHLLHILTFIFLHVFQCIKIGSNIVCVIQAELYYLATDGYRTCLWVHVLWRLRSFPSCSTNVLFPMGVWHSLCDQHRCRLLTCG